MDTPAFTDLIGDEDRFFSTYFDRRPLLRRGALRGDPAALLSFADLDDLLHSAALRPPYLALTKSGRPVPPEVYTRAVDVQDRYVPDSVDPERVMAHLRTGATLTCNAINHLRPALRALAGTVSTGMGGRADVVAFLTPAGHTGYLPHRDPTDVFVIQLAGRKHWRVWPTPAQRSGPSHPRPADLGEPEHDLLLCPGDVLYMPYGTAHVATAREEMSLHLSVIVRPRSWADLVTATVARLVAADPALTGRPRPGSPDAAELARHCKSLADRLSTLDADELVGEESAAPADAGGHGLRYLAAVDELTGSTPVRLGRGVRVEAAPGTGDKGRVHVDGNVYAMSTEVILALTALAGGGHRAAGSLLAGASPARSLDSARTLARIGVLDVVEIRPGAAASVEAPGGSR